MLIELRSALVATSEDGRTVTLTEGSNVNYSSQLKGAHEVHRIVVVRDGVTYTASSTTMRGQSPIWL